jgi:hypothetical protein
LQQASEVDLSVNQFKMADLASDLGTNREKIIRVAALMLAHQDLTYRDLLSSIAKAQEPLKGAYCSDLRRVSPHSPLGITRTIECEWEFAAPRAAQWEKQFASSSQVQYSLGRQLLKQKKNADAIRCLQRATELSWNVDAFERLASAHLMEKDEKQWRATWERFLTGQEVGLQHSRARVIIAERLVL